MEGIGTAEAAGEYGCATGPQYVYHFTAFYMSHHVSGMALRDDSEPANEIIQDCTVQRLIAAGDAALHNGEMLNALDIPAVTLPPFTLPL